MDPFPPRPATAAGHPSAGPARPRPATFDSTGSGSWPAKPHPADSPGYHPRPDGRERSGYREHRDGFAPPAADVPGRGPGTPTSTGGFSITPDTQRRTDETTTLRPVGETTGTRRAGAEPARALRPSETSGSHRALSETTGSLRRLGQTTGSHRVVSDSTGAPESPGELTQRWSRANSGQTATGYHRAMGKAAGRRKVAKWPIVAGGFVVLLVVGLLGWGWANNVLNSRAEAQANGCADGDATMKVLVAPAVEKPVQAAAARWNQARTVVHAHCINVAVTPMPAARALDALTGRNSLDSIGGLPAAWIADNGSSVNQLQTAKPAMIASPAESIAYTPSADYQFVGLTGETLDEVQARAAQVFRDYLREPAQQADFTAAGLTPR